MLWVVRLREYLCDCWSQGKSPSFVSGHFDNLCSIRWEHVSKNFKHCNVLITIKVRDDWVGDLVKYLHPLMVGFRVKCCVPFALLKGPDVDVGGNHGDIGWGGPHCQVLLHQGLPAASTLRNEKRKHKEGLQGSSRVATGENYNRETRHSYTLLILAGNAYLGWAYPC